MSDSSTSDGQALKPQRWRRFSIADLLCVIACSAVGFGISRAAMPPGPDFALEFLLIAATTGAMVLGPSLGILQYLRGRRIRPTPCETLALVPCSLGVVMLISFALTLGRLGGGLFFTAPILILVLGPIYLIHENDRPDRLDPPPWTARLGAFLIAWNTVSPCLIGWLIMSED